MIRVSHLSKTYDRRSKLASQALYDVSFELPDRGFVCIVGPSGCGKTSLLNAMGGLDTFDTGQISTDDLENLRCGSRSTEAERNRNFGYIFQNYYLLPEYSAAYNVYLGMHALDLSHEEKLKRAVQALETVDMDRFARRAVGELSGGQQQRVAIARALARRPRVIFADEPTGNLDEANTMNICALLRRIARDSLVIMVTHEERIARFFADRIIALESGHLKQDSDSWQRGRMSVGTGQLYVSDFAQTEVEAQGVTLRFLREEGASPVNLTVVAQRDRVIIKLEDERVVACGRPDQPPALTEGERPVLRLESLEQEDMDLMWDEPVPQAPAGSGLTLPMMLREAGRLEKGRGLRRVGSWLFLVVITVLTALTLGDYLKVSALEPEDVITTDSHILELNFQRGDRLEANILTLRSLIYEYLDHLEASGQDFDYVPVIPVQASYIVSSFLQLGSESEPLGSFSYVPLERLDEETLIYGRMPERSDEIVVDRWVLEAMMEREGILQSGLSQVPQFLDQQLHYAGKNYIPTIVGISDCGEPAVFVNRAGLASLGSRGTQIISLSELQRIFPGKYDDVTLGTDECVIVTNNAGMDYVNQVGGVYATNAQVILTIASTIEEDTYASLVVADETADTILRSMMSDRFYLYCQDKQAMKDYIAAGMPQELDGRLKVEVTDRNSDDWASYRASVQLRMDGRRIVTFTILALCLVMLFLLQRSRVQERIGMVAVYRLLGIPGRKLSGIFTLECLLLSLRSTLPAAAAVWAVLAVLSRFPLIDAPYLLPWYAAVGIYVGITVLHLLASLLPLGKLLRQPPARLASRYDI